MITEVDKPPFRAMFLRRYTLSCVMTSDLTTSSPTGLSLVSRHRGAILESFKIHCGEKEEEFTLFSGKLYLYEKGETINVNTNIIRNALYKNNLWLMWVYISHASAFLESHENLFVKIKKYCIKLQLFNVNYTQFCFSLLYIITLLEVLQALTHWRKCRLVKFLTRGGKNGNV